MILSKTQFLPDYLTMIVSKYELVPSVYVIGGYSTQPYQATSKFPMEDLLNSETKEVIQPILRYKNILQVQPFYMVHMISTIIWSILYG